MESDVKSADEIFKEFKEHSITEFFRKNSQMLGYAGKVRSLTTLVHEYVTNSVTYETPTIVMIDGFVRIMKIGEVVDSLIDECAGEPSFGNGAESLRKITKNIKILCFDKKSLKLKFKELNAVHRHKMEPDEKIYKITTTGGRSVDATKHHSLFRLVEGRVTSAEAGTLSNEDCLIVPKTCSLPLDSTVNQLNLIEESIRLPKEETEKIGIYGAKSILYALPELKNKIKSQLSKKDRHYTFYSYYMSCDRLPINLIRCLPAEERKLFYGCKIGFKKGEHLINNLLELNEEFAGFLGLFVAEGSTRKTLVDCSISLSMDEKELISYASSAIKNIFGINAYVHAAHKTAINVTIPSKMVVFVLAKLLRCGMSAREKTVPDIIFNAESAIARQFLVGYACGDGYPTKVFTEVLLGRRSINELNMKAVLSTASQELCTTLIYLLSFLGYSSNVSEKEGECRIINKVEAHFGKSYTIEVWMRQKNSPLNYLPLNLFDTAQITEPKLRWAINTRGQKMVMMERAIALKSQISISEDTSLLMNSDLRFLKIRDISVRIPIDGECVYDYSVENDENFVGGTGPICLHNSLDACEEANILPDIEVSVKEISENKYAIRVSDNGPGIPTKHIGKALASVLTGTKFHRHMQQRGQQGIGAGGCTLFALMTTGKGIHVKSGTGAEAYECNLGIDIKGNKPLVSDMVRIEPNFKGLMIEGEFGDVKYEKGDHGVYEYIRRTALSNPHISIKLTEPEGNECIFPRSVDIMPHKPKQIKLHPLGLSTTDILDFAKTSSSRKITSFLIESFSRVTQEKVKELAELAKDVDLEKDPKGLNWQDAQKIVNAFKQMKWIAPELDALSTIGEKQIEIAMKNILDPRFMSVVERKPKVFKGGIPFVVEVGIAYGGKAGKVAGDAVSGSILRFANRVPLLFDTGSCAITEAVNGIEWKRYSIARFEEEPVSVLVNVSSVHIPYSGVGKQAIAQEEEIEEEIKLATMEAGRKLERFLSGERHRNVQESGYKTIMRYVSQLSSDLEEITGKKKEETEKELKALIEKKYKNLFRQDEASNDVQSTN